MLYGLILNTWLDCDFLVASATPLAPWILKRKEGSVVDEGMRRREEKSGGLEEMFY